MKTTRYLNTDLDLISAVDLTELAAAFEAKGVFSLHVTCAEEGRWFATFEVESKFDTEGELIQHSESEQTIVEMLEVIESFEVSIRSLWDGCLKREFNIGYECGKALRSFEQGLSSETLHRIVALQASLRWTLYPHQG